MIRRKYKQEYLNTREELGRYIIKYEDCKKYIKEARKIIIDHGLQKELNHILNSKYGMTLIGTIGSINNELDGKN